jgi:hypothetical protein
MKATAVCIRAGIMIYILILICLAGILIDILIKHFCCPDNKSQLNTAFPLDETVFDHHFTVLGKCTGWYGPHFHLDR